MSFNLTKLVLSKQCGGAVAKALLLVMSGHASADGSQVYPSVATLSAEAELSERKTRHLLADFRARGLIAVAGKHPCRNGYTIEYRLCVAAIEALPNCSAKSLMAKPTGAHDAPVHDVHTTGAPDAPQEVHGMHPNKPKNKSGNKPGGPEATDDAFETAWRMWPAAPRPSSKPESRRIWVTLASKHGTDRLLDAVRKYLRSKDATTDNKRYIRKMQNWLREDAGPLIESSLEEAPKAHRSADLPMAPDWWRDAAADMQNCSAGNWQKYGARCRAVDGESRALEAPNELIREKVERLLAMRGHRIRVVLAGGDSLGR